MRYSLKKTNRNVYCYPARTDRKYSKVDNSLTKLNKTYLFCFGNEVLLSQTHKEET